VWGVMCGAAASGNYHWIWNPFDPNDRDVMLGLTDAAKGFDTSKQAFIKY
jgi:chlorophyll synthase